MPNAHDHGRPHQRRFILYGDIIGWKYERGHPNASTHSLTPALTAVPGYQLTIEVVHLIVGRGCAD